MQFKWQEHDNSKMIQNLLHRASINSAPHWWKGWWPWIHNNRNDCPWFIVCPHLPRFHHCQGEQLFPFFFPFIWHYMTPCDTMCDTLWHFMTLCDTMWHCVTLYDTVWHYVTLYDTVWHCVTLATRLFQKRGGWKGVSMQLADQKWSRILIMEWTTGLFKYIWIFFQWPVDVWNKHMIFLNR